MEAGPCEETRLFFTYRPETPIGRLRAAGYLKDTFRFFHWPMRRVEFYVLVYVTEGAGRFMDTLGNDEPIQAGDLILLFPETAYKYGPKRGGRWSELYAEFEGPVFDLCRRTGLLDPERPVRRPAQAAHWRRQLETVLTRAVGDDTLGQLDQLLQFLSVLTQMAAPATAVRAESQPPWLRTALSLLDQDLSTERPLSDVAAILGLPYHTFRKHFQRAMGLAPAQYRFARRMDAACSMLLHTKMSVREIAEALNFSDAFHFSNRFQGHTGLRPGKYRQEGRRGMPPPASQPPRPTQRDNSRPPERDATRPRE